MVRFLWASKVSAAEIHRQLVDVCDKIVTSPHGVPEQCRMFAVGRRDINHESRDGRLSAPATEVNVAGNEELFRRINLAVLHIQFTLVRVGRVKL